MTVVLPVVVGEKGPPRVDRGIMPIADACGQKYHTPMHARTNGLRRIGHAPVRHAAMQDGVAVLATSVPVDALRVFYSTRCPGSDAMCCVQCVVCAMLSKHIRWIVHAVLSVLRRACSLAPFLTVLVRAVWCSRQLTAPSQSHVQAM